MAKDSMKVNLRLERIFSTIPYAAGGQNHYGLRARVLLTVLGLVWGFPKLGVLLSVPRIRILAFGGLYLAPLLRGTTVFSWLRFGIGGLTLFPLRASRLVAEGMPGSSHCQPQSSEASPSRT